MSRYAIEGCEFAFKCPRQWEQLAETDTEDKRYCVSCERTVHLCDDPLLFELHAKAGHCVAVPDPARKRLYLGAPATEYHPTPLDRD